MTRRRFQRSPHLVPFKLLEQPLALGLEGKVKEAPDPDLASSCAVLLPETSVLFVEITFEKQVELLEFFCLFFNLKTIVLKPPISLFDSSRIPVL